MWLMGEAQGIGMGMLAYPCAHLIFLFVWCPCSSADCHYAE
jgi:hypothetical protein